MQHILRTFREFNPDRKEVDHLPIGYHAVAVHNKEGREREAASMFKTALTMPSEHDIAAADNARRRGDPLLNAYDEVWLRANYGRLLRRMGKEEEADAQVALIV